MKDYRWTVLGCLVVLWTTGCTQITGQWSSKDWMTPSFLSGKSDEEPTLPSRVMTIWTDAIHHQKDQPAQRGFGGRILFYDDEGTEPIKVDGKLTVYVFSDEPGQQNNRPERKFVFPAEQLKRHYSSGSLGHSYSVWLPWDEVGGSSRQLSLITRFDGVNGGTVISEPARKLLPGRSPAPETRDTSTQASVASPVSQAGYISPIESKQPISRLDAPRAGLSPGDSASVSLASFVASESQMAQSQVETIDLQQARQQNSQTTTYSVPASLGLRGGSVMPVRSRERMPAQDAPGYDEGSEERSPGFDQVPGMTALPTGSASGIRVEQQSGATVYYGRPGANWEQLSLQEAVASAKDGQGVKANEQELANPLTDSQTLRTNQLQSIRASRQQFRSEPWRFPVRTQAISRQSASDAR